MRRTSRVLDWLATVPRWLAGAMFGAGTILATAHLQMISIYVERPPEWPYWVERATLQWYWVLLPLSIILLWTRRRHVEGRLGYAGAVLAGLGILNYVVLTLLLVVWDGLLSLGDLPDWILATELLLLAGILGLFLLSVAFLRDRGVPSIWPVLLLLGMVGRVIFPLPYFMSAAWLILAALVILGRPHPRQRVNNGVLSMQRAD